MQLARLSCHRLDDYSVMNIDVALNMAGWDFLAATLER
jgi:hypothetical protein